MAKTISIALTKLLCIEETDGFFLEDDEPYVVVFAADLMSFPSAVEVTTYPFRNVSSGEVHVTIPLIPQLGDIDPLGELGLPFRRLCWGINGKPTPIPDPDRVVLLVGLMENDSAKINAVRTTVKSMLTASLVAGVGARLSRDELVSKLIKDMNGALDTGAATGGLDPDERIGSVKELRIKKKDLVSGASATVIKRLDYYGEGAHYRVRFELTSS